MGSTSAPRAGLAIVRGWIEDEHPSPLRARVTTIDDLAGTGGVVDWSGSEADAVLAHLAAWLDAWLARS